MGLSKIFETLLSGGVEKIIGSIGDVLDENFTSDEERLKAQRALEKIKQKAKIAQLEMAQQAESAAQNAVTERWRIDHDGNFLTRSIRPITLIYLTIVVTVLALTDGNITFDYLNEKKELVTYTFSIKQQWQDAFANAWGIVLAAFFVGKTAERFNAKIA